MTRENKEFTEDIALVNERLQLIAKATHDVIWDWDVETNQVWWNEGYQTVFGYEKKDISPTIASWSDFIHPDDRERVLDTIHAVLDHGEANWTAQYRFRRADGSYAFILDRGYTIHRNGQPVRMVGSMVDLSKQKAIEEELVRKNRELENLLRQFEFVTDFMPQMVWSTWPDGRHDFFNRQWYDYTGLSYDESKEDRWATVLHPEDREKTAQVWTHSLETGEPYEIEYRMRRFDGVFRWMLGRALPLRDEQGRITKWFGTCTDIEDQKNQAALLEQMVAQRTQDLNALNQDLKRSNENLQQFAYVASHDLQEPLRKIQSFGTLLQHQFADQLGSSGDDLVSRMQSAASRMSVLIKDLLTYSRISTHRQVFRPLSLSQVLSEAINTLELQIQESGASIRSDKLPDIEGDSLQLNQLFQNLLSNSLKFRSPGVTPVIQILYDTLPVVDLPPGLTPTSSADRFHRIRFVDNGIGFDEKYLDRIFHVFQRLHGKTSFAGTGIGLAICQKVAENHGGAITARSVPGQGASFDVYLPQLN